VIFGEHVSVHGVASVVVMFRHQPPDIVPASPAVSSLTYSFHTPFAIVPLNALSALPPDGTGAGAVNTSPAPLLVGLNVPDTSGPASGRLAAAASSKVNVTLLAGVAPPTSDRMMAF